jgi:hypothetical protein
MGTLWIHWVVSLEFLKEVIKCGLGLDSGIPGHGMGIELLMGIPIENMAMVILGELCPRRKK